MSIILVIDDHNGMRENICELLELENHTVHSAASGEEGLILAREKRPHVILCDIHMPGMNGYDFFAAMKKDDAISNTPIVLTSAFVDPFEVKIGMEKGVKAYLNKSFEADELYGLLRECVVS